MGNLKQKPEGPLSLPATNPPHKKDTKRTQKGQDFETEISALSVVIFLLVRKMESPNPPTLSSCSGLTWDESWETFPSN